MPHDRFLLQDRLWMITEPVGVSVYDFDFRQFFDCRTPYEFPQGVPAVARVGAFSDYPSFFKEAKSMGLSLVHSPDDYLRCTSLPQWYPLIEKFTPRSRWFSEIPSFEQVEAEFELPIFVKGARQTSKHSAAASVIRSRGDFDRSIEIFRNDPILHWQELVCRELLDLRPVAGGVETKVPASFEFRTFWWRGQLVGAGRYWFEADEYSWTDSEREAAIAVAKHAVDALECAFLVVDLAQTVEGQWVIIECNDGMESGYAGASPFAIWQNALEIEARGEVRGNGSSRD